MEFKYPSGAVITDSPFKPVAIRGQQLIGDLYLEVSVQNNPVPQRILDVATNKNITIIDVTGKVYN